MPLSSLVLSQPLCAALSRKIEVESVLHYISRKGENEWSAHEWEITDWHKETFKVIPAFTLGEMPAVFQALVEVMGGEGLFTWELHWLEFCRLYATSKEDAEQYLFSLLK